MMMRKEFKPFKTVVVLALLHGGFRGAISQNRAAANFADR